MENKNTCFVCEICKKNYASQSSLCNHNKKFHYKEKSKIYKCKHCDKTYNILQSRWKHQKTCNKKEEESQNIIINKKNKIQNTINNNNTRNINHGTINNNIIINNYKNDNIEYVSEKFKDNLFNQLKNKKNQIKPIPYIIENIKFNPVHKENHNVRIKSDRSKIGLIYDEHKWKAINKNELLDDLMKYGFKIFQKYYNERKDKLSENIIDNYDEFEKTYKTDLKKEIKDKIENIAYIFTLNNDDENPLD